MIFLEIMRILLLNAMVYSGVPGLPKLSMSQVIGFDLV